MGRLTDHDKKFGPIAYAKAGWNPWRVMWCSGGDDDNDEPIRNTLTVYAIGWVARIYLPTILQPYRIRHWPKSWDAETVARLGRDWYDEIFPREYGFSICDGALHLHYGPQTHDSITTKGRCYFIPWQQWRFIRTSLYNPDGSRFYTQMANSKNGLDGYREMSAQEELLSKVKFAFDDYDGKRIIATCHIEEREWHFGEGWFRWLRFFRKPLIRRALYMSFDSEVGPEKGSWKGGTIGTSINMEKSETCESAFRRYCDKTHNAKYREYKITFVEPIESPRP